MTTEKQSSYFLRTQSVILNGEINNNRNSLRDNIKPNKSHLNKNYLSTGNNRKKNRRYISKSNNPKMKKNPKKKYVGIDLQKVCGASHVYNKRNKNIKYNNKIPIRKSLNYYQYLTKKDNKKKEEEKNINENEKNERIIYKLNSYSPFHQIISNIKNINKPNNYILRNDYNTNKFSIIAKTNRHNTNPKIKNFFENEKNNQYFSIYRKYTNEKSVYTNNIDNNNNRSEYVTTYKYNNNNNFSKPNDSKFTYTFNTNQINNNKSLYLNEDINDNEIISKRIKLMNQIKDITKTNQYSSNNNEEITKKNKNKSYSSNDYNNINNNNSKYTPLPYKSFLKSIFDQNYTNKFLNDFNKLSSHAYKKNNNTFDYNKSRRHKIITKGFLEIEDDENKLKKLLENIPRHIKEKNKSEIYFVNNLNENKSNNKKKIDNIIRTNKSNNTTKNFLEQINYVMPPNKVIDKNDDNK